jgi:outer membrane protein TolC
VPRTIAAVLLSVTVLTAQQSPLTLSRAVAGALQTYPSIKISEEKAKQAAAAIDLARTAWLPRLDTLAQVNRATRNNVFGLLLPQTVIPSISGPVTGANNLGTVWGSAVGGLVTWEPFDFGLREANVAIAAAGKRQRDAATRRTRFDVSAVAADAYLTLIAAEETVGAAQAGVDRASGLLTAITAQVNAQLRPGADQSRADAELAAARTQLIQAQQAVEVSRANLAQFTGTDPAAIAVSAGNLLSPPPERKQQPFSAEANPASVEQAAVLEEARAELHAMERSYFPKFALQGSLYARGTGAEINGGRLGGLNGLAPTFQNYALGLSVTFPLLDYVAVRAREAGQSAAIRAQEAQAAQIAVELRAQWNRAVASLEGARRIAENTPVQAAAARAAFDQARARYQSGLAGIVEVTEAQRLLTGSEIDDALARLNVWRGLLAVAVAAGDIEPFVAEAGGAH